MEKTLRLRGGKGWRMEKEDNTRTESTQRLSGKGEGRQKMCRREGEIKRKKKVRLFGVFLPFCATLVDLLMIKQAEAGLT